MANTQAEFLKTTKDKNCLVHESYVYNFHENRGTRAIYRCNRNRKDEKCGSKVSVRDGLLTGDPSNHNHGPDPNEVPALRLNNQMKVRATRESTPYARIYKETVAPLAATREGRLLAAVIPSARTAATALSRARLATRPPAPRSRAEVDVTAPVTRDLDGQNFIIGNNFCCGNYLLLLAGI